MTRFQHTSRRGDSERIAAGLAGRTTWLHLAMGLLVLSGCGGPSETKPASTTQQDTAEARVIGAVLATSRDAGGTVGGRMAEKGITDEWKAEAITEANRSEIEGSLGFPIGQGPAYVVEVQHDYGTASPTIYRWVAIGGGDGAPVTVYPVNGHALEIQGDSAAKQAFNAHRKAKAQVKHVSNRKYDVTFTKSGNYRTPEILPFESEVAAALQAEFDANPAPDPDSFANDEDFFQADKAAEDACIQRVARRYGLTSKVTKAIYMKVGLTQ